MCGNTNLLSEHIDQSTWWDLMMKWHRSNNSSELSPLLLLASSTQFTIIWVHVFLSAHPITATNPSNQILIRSTSSLPLQHLFVHFCPSYPTSHLSPCRRIQLPLSVAGTHWWPLFASILQAFNRSTAFSLFARPYWWNLKVSRFATDVDRRQQNNEEQMSPS